MSESQALAPTLMVQGTASDVGKSILTAALCRILVQDGKRVAPYKSQNMSLNSYVTFDGKEIGRAQGVQADACRILATTDMNPILLKPKQDMVSQVVVHGKPYMDLDARTYRESYLPQAEQIVKDALNRLREQYEIVVLEGAGSPAEVNLKDRDIVNMRLAGWADAPVILVADIDRGGVFASIVGTLEILTPEERSRVKGFIINKFRGDVSLLKPGLDWLEERTGKPVLGVIPYLPQLGIEDEDSASLDSKRKQKASEPQPGKTPGQIEVAVIRLPRISNFTDFDPLQEEKDVYFRYISDLSEWGEPDAVILPGSKNTMADLEFLKESGLVDMLLKHAQTEGRYVTGICAGYQMLGRTLLDPELLESDKPELSGLGLLPTETIFTGDKRTLQVEGLSRLYATGEELAIEGYEIHMGRTRFVESTEHPFRIRSESEEWHADGASELDGRVWGTYLHGILHNDDFRRAWLNEIRLSKGLPPLETGLRFKEKREAAFDRLAEHVRQHLDMAQIYEMMGI
jgi:adenosylcobyric acid synthase